MQVASPAHSSSLGSAPKSVEESTENSEHQESIETIVDTRRDFMAKSLGTVGSVATAATTGFGVLAPPPALAVKGADKVNASLKA